jgi:hypothetical protein
MNIQEIFANWGGAIGAGIGVLGGAFGAWCSIRNTNGPKERAFMVKAAIWTWLFAAAVLGLMFGLRYALPGPYKLLSFLAIFLIIPALCIGIPMCNRRQAQIRAEEAQSASRGQCVTRR